MADPATSGRLGLALVVCAPSGTGKSTLVKKLTAEFGEFEFSVSCTTRAPRHGETDGRDYHFVSHERFQEMIDAEEFAEWAEVHGNFYGTPKLPVRRHLSAGRDVLFDIDVQGAMQLRHTLPDAAFVFILPPSRAELERRLTGRGTDDAEAVARRLANARGELERARAFGHWVVNDDLDEADRKSVV